MISRNTNNNSGSVARLLITCCGLILLGLSSAIVAQDEVGIEEVVVTAQRREQNLQDVPISISAFSAEAVEAFMFNDVTEYVTRTPNISWKSDGARSRRELSIRGVTNFLDVNSTLRPATYAFYVDDFSIVGSSSNPPIMDVERIEVLRGPQATYFGRNATGGGISITSKKPHTDSLAGSVMVDYSNYDTKDIEGIVNVPIMKDVLAIRGNIKYNESDGNIKNVNPIGGGNDWEYKYARAAIRFTPTDELTVDVTGTLASETTGMREGVPSGHWSFFAVRLYGRDIAHFEDPDGDGFTQPLHDGIGFWPENRNKVNFDFPQEVGTTYRMITGRVDYELEKVLFTSITGYINSDFNLNGDVDGSSIDGWNEFRNIKRTSFSHEMRIQSNDDSSRLRWNIGGLYAEDDGHFISDTFTGRDNGFGLPPWLRIGGGDEQDGIEGWHLFGQVEADFTKNLTLSFGGRYSEEIRRVTENFFPLGQPSVHISVKEKFTSFSPRFALTYAINDDINLYSSISKGFKSGGVTRFGEDGIPFDPEIVWNYEVGVKADLLKNRLRVNAAAFYMDWSDMHVGFLVPQLGGQVGGSVVSNADSASSKGVEVSLTALPVDDLIVNFNVGYLKARLDKATVFIRDNVCNHRPPSTECNHVLDGSTTPMSPEWTMAADAEYTFNITPTYDGFARVEWTFRDTVDRPQVEDLIKPDEFPWRVPSYDFFNVRAGVRHKNFTVTGYAENVFNSHYYQNAYRKAWAGGVSLEPSLRSYGIRVRYTYGE
ncbi:MAG: TonB-dependent receptor [Gammaproteobacteria bacterium]|nr:TonB-dependent receptor [Gammaproteobacteria bacterium]MDE0284034.1 TonB-dependent receptor [Gammaproteobacteria bacterium]